MQTIQIASKLLNKLETLERSLDDNLGIMNMEVSEVDSDAVLKNLCEYYTNLTGKLYDSHLKLQRLMKKIAWSKGYETEEAIVKKVEEKSNKLISKRMEMYNKIRDIEKIIEARNPFIPIERNENESQNEGRDGMMSEERKMS